MASKRRLARDRSWYCRRDWEKGSGRRSAPAPRDAPVWLEFRRPFGYLPVIPWERLVQPFLGIPLLRLPFSAVSAVVRSNPLRIALCAPLVGTAALVEFLQEVVPALPTRTRVDVFTTDPQVHVVAPVGPDREVIFHVPPDTLDEDVEPPGISGEQAEASLEPVAALDGGDDRWRVSMWCTSSVPDGCLAISACWASVLHPPAVKVIVRCGW